MLLLYRLQFLLPRLYLRSHPRSRQTVERLVLLLPWCIVNLQWSGPSSNRSGRVGGTMRHRGRVGGTRRNRDHVGVYTQQSWPFRVRDGENQSYYHYYFMYCYFSLTLYSGWLRWRISVHTHLSGALRTQGIFDDADACWECEAFWLITESRTPGAARLAEKEGRQRPEVW